MVRILWAWLALARAWLARAHTLTSARRAVSTPPPTHPTHRVQPEGAYKYAELLDAEGLPHVGAAVWPGQEYYCAVEALTGKAKAGKLKGEETAVVDQVTTLSCLPSFVLCFSAVIAF